MKTNLLKVEFNPDEKVFFAWFPELPGCMADGKTEEEAVKELMKVKNKWLKIAAQTGFKINDG